MINLIWPELFDLAKKILPCFFVFCLIVILICNILNKIKIKWVENTYKWVKKKYNSIKKNIVTIVIWLSGIYAIFFLLASFFAPSHLSIYPLELSESSNFATSINGLMSPYIAVAAAILTFMAFWVQYNANQNIHKENKKEQIERQFYEMLKIHREMVSDFDFSYAGVGDQTQNTYYATCLAAYPYSRKSYKIEGKNQSFTHIHCKGQNAIYWFLRELMFIYEVVKEDNKTVKENFKVAYQLFFEGLDDCSKLFTDKKKNDLENIRFAIHWHRYDIIEKKTKDLIEKYKFDEIQTIIFQGHRSIFNPYYRHLFLIVKKIVKDDFFSEDEKMAYLSMLRAQMTSEEQMLLFYNWYSDYGYQWEQKNENSFFSQYKMIHNVDYKYYKFLGLKIFKCFSWVKKERKITMFEFFEQKKKKLKI